MGHRLRGPSARPDAGHARVLSGGLAWGIGARRAIRRVLFMEPFCLFVGDLHAGSIHAVTAKPQNDRQAWLIDTWAAMVKRGLALAQGREFYLMLGGDLVDEPGKKARDDAITLLQPLANVAAAVYGVPGTEYHVGDDGEEDRTVYDALGARGERQRQVHRLRIGGRVLWWAHHAVRLGGQPWTEFDGLYRGAKTAWEFSKLQDQPPPALVMAHHVHRSPGVARYRDTEVAVCPCWQLQTPYGAKLVSWSLPTIGAVGWWPVENRVEIMRYAIPPELISA